MTYRKGLVDEKPWQKQSRITLASSLAQCLAKDATRNLFSLWLFCNLFATIQANGFEFRWYHETHASS
ncbi:MAG: hypothetical protein J6J24_02725 [Clostridia bacterium]|nr:hypothetical protein [Clostridia bacterium]